MSTYNPLQFVEQVRSEVKKIVWPTRRETTITTILVFVMAALFALFFFFIDQIIQFGLSFLL